MDPDPTQETAPTPAVRPAPSSPISRFVRSMPGALLIIALSLGGILALAGMAGYLAGNSDRDRVAATAQAVELGRQFQLGLEDLSAGRPTLAIQRFQFILSIDPAYPAAAQRLAEAQAAVPQSTGSAPGPTSLPSPTPIITVGPETAKQLFEAAQGAYDQKQWDEALQKIGALKVINSDYERAAVRSMQFKALQFRAIAYIDAGKLELGLADLDQASKIGTLTEDAQQHQQWAEIYIAGVSYWGLNWSRTVETFQLLYKIAPYFRDTSARLHDAQLAYARQFDALGQPCDAVAHYTEALKLQPDQAVDDKRSAAQDACQNGTPTPNGSETATPGTGTPAPSATATGAVAPTNTIVAANPPAATNSPTATNNPPTATGVPAATAAPTLTSTLTATTPAASDTPAATPTETETPTSAPA